MLDHVLLVTIELCLAPGPEFAGALHRSRRVVQGVHHEVVPVGPVADHHVERCGRRALLAESPDVEPVGVGSAVDQLVDGVKTAAGLLDDMARQHPGAIHHISQELCQEDGDQTRRMAGTILANAFMFHEILAGGQDDLANVHSLEQLRGSSTGLSKSSVLAEWRKILTVNYWPIFDIARRILEIIPTAQSKALIDVLAATSDKLLQNRLMRSHELTGAVFQRLIADPKFLAAFYTTPASASLLV